MDGRIFPAHLARRHVRTWLNDEYTVHSPLSETFAHHLPLQDKNSKQEWRDASGLKPLLEERKKMRKGRDCGWMRALARVSF